MTKGVGDIFQQESKYSRGRMGGGRGMTGPQPELYKQYPDRTSFKLPSPAGNQSTLENALKARRSVRQYKNEPIDMDQLSYLLWASTGISLSKNNFSYRTAPSAGALYPIETYLVVNNVKGLAPGLYHYNIQEHSLELLREEKLGKEFALAALGQAMPSTAPVVFVWTAVYQRSSWKYEQRAFRYVYLDCAHIAQNLVLASVSLGLGTVQIGAFYDDEINKLLQIDGKTESILYLSPVGYPK